MAEVADILTNVTKRLEETFGIPVIDKDIEEDIPRPAFVIDADEIKRDMFGLMEHIEFKLRIIYFAPSIYNGYAELYGVLDNLAAAFEGRIKINETFNYTLEEQEGTIYKADMAVELSGKIDIVNPYLENEEDQKDMLELDVQVKEKKGVI